MISKEVYMDIRAMKRSGKSIRTIAKELGLHRSTVKKHLEHADFPQYRKDKRKDSILAPYEQTIRDFLSVDSYRATWILDRLRERGYLGGYNLVKRFVREIKAQNNRLAYIRFETEPGRQAQFDWGDFQIEESGGRTSKVFVFILVLGYSRADYVEFVDRCTLETLLDGHIRGFKYLGGVPAEILYDNMKHVVLGRDAAGKPVFNPECLHFAHHYGFQPRACAPYSPWMKGKVERPIDFLRERFWRGYHYSSLRQANQDVLAWLNETANRRVHGTHHQSIEERWAQERPRLGPLPAFDYDTSLKTFRKVYRDCQISFDANRYVVPHRAVGQTVLLKVKNGQIRIFLDQNLLATYTEPTTKHNVLAHPQFYEDLRKDREQLRRKYGRAKGKATRGLSHGSLLIDVDQRSLRVYDELAQGGISWNN
jgi:transposase